MGVCLLAVLLAVLCGCEKHEHSYISETAVVPQCMDDGVMSYTCSCGDSYTEPIAARGEHEWDEGTQAEPVLCLEDGLLLYTCVLCGETESETITAPGEHTWGEPAADKLPSCMEAGQNSITCSVCGEVQYTELAALGHTWDEGRTTAEPDCVTEGVFTYLCMTCGEEKNETIPATGEHAWDNGRVTAKPTCGKQGVKTYSCRQCGEKRTEDIPVLEEHTWDDGKVIKPSNCIELGDKEYTCTVCGKIRAVKIGLTKSHTWDSGTVVKAATCGSAGEKRYSCIHCGEEKTQTVPATAVHTWDSGKVTHAQTCGTDGSRVYTCSVCGASYTEKIAASGAHTWDEGRVTKAATIMSEGTRTFYCTVCGRSGQSPIPKVVDEKTAVYTSDRFLYVNDIPVHGLLKMNGKYYIPIDIFENENIVSYGHSGFYDDRYSISFYTRSYEKYGSTIRSDRTPDGKLVGSGEQTDYKFKFNDTVTEGNVWMLNGEMAMVCIDTLGAVKKGEDFALNIDVEVPVSKEEDLLASVIPTLRRTTDRETVIAIHDWIVNTITYDPLVSRPWWATDEYYQEVYNIVSTAEEKYLLPNNQTLSAKYGVCQNYAEIFQEICIRMGIPCMFIGGMGNGGSHAWNKVSIDGEWLYVDCTFDDPVSQTPVLSHDYCLVGAEAMAANHAWSGDDYPMPDEYDPAWEQLDCSNITSADMFRKCLIAQLMQKKTHFVLRTTAYGAYGGFACIYKYNVRFWTIGYGYDYDQGGYVVDVEYWE